MAERPKSFRKATVRNQLEDSIVNKREDEVIDPSSIDETPIPKTVVFVYLRYQPTGTINIRCRCPTSKNGDPVRCLSA